LLRPAFFTAFVHHRGACAEFLDLQQRASGVYIVTISPAAYWSGPGSIGVASHQGMTCGNPVIQGKEKPAEKQ
jgi:hypothetical protein